EGAADPRDAIPTGLVRRADTIRLPYHRRQGVARIYRNSSRMLRGRLPLMDRFSTPETMTVARTTLGGRRYRLAVIEHFWCADFLPLLRDIADIVVLDL